MYWILVISTITAGPAGAPSLGTGTTRVANEATCRQMELDYTYNRKLAVGTQLVDTRGHARCYYDGPEIGSVQR